MLGGICPVWCNLNHVSEVMGSIPNLPLPLSVTWLPKALCLVSFCLQSPWFYPLCYSCGSCLCAFSLEMHWLRQGALRRRLFLHSSTPLLFASISSLPFYRLWVVWHMRCGKITIVFRTKGAVGVELVYILMRATTITTTITTILTTLTSNTTVIVNFMGRKLMPSAIPPPNCRIHASTLPIQVSGIH